MDGLRGRAAMIAAALFLGLALASCGGPDGQQAADFPQGPQLGTAFDALYRPPGEGRHPAVVLLSTCGGVSQTLENWGTTLEDWGYVALVVDSFTPRRQTNVCGRWAVTIDEVADDALAALDRLRSFAYVDGNAVAVMGFSYGAQAALRLASRDYRRRRHPQGPAFAAAVAFYPYCTWTGGRRDLQDNLRDDIAAPLLIIGGEFDGEAPPQLCAQKGRRLADEGEPVTVRILAGATHAFDMAEFGASGVRGWSGAPYRYNAAATETARAMTRDFLAQHLAAGADR